VAADPIGYLELGPEGAVFRPIRESYPSPAFLVASALAAAILIRALARLAGRRPEWPPAFRLDACRPG
jgi:hypothetical protein